MEVEINGKKLKLKYCFRAHIAYETLTGEAFKWNGYKELGLFLYCLMLVQSNDLTYEAFEAWLDENIYVLEEFAKWLTSVMAVAHRLSTASADTVQDGEPSAETPSAEKK